MAIERIRKYLKEKNVEIDDALLKYLEKGLDIMDKDEYKHVLDVPKYPLHHNESWYFNFLDFNSDVYMITRVSFQMGMKESDVMLVLIVDDKPTAYFNRLKVEDFPKDDIYGDKKVKFECLEPMKKWRVTFLHRKHEVDVIFEARFPPFNYMSNEDPLETIKEFGVEILDVAAQQHYEQGMKVTGTLKIKEKREVKEVRQINCHGHRDHSWGTRDWVNIDRWNWMAAQFDDCTINAFRSEVFGKVPKGGFISTAEGNEKVIDVEVETEFGHEGKEKAPKSSRFKIKTPIRELLIVSHTRKSLYLQRPSEGGLAEIYEQIVEFEMNGKKGYGISEYMTSIKTK
ncbi:MAG: DUF7064 domain-containing protein [Candidatus Helarchaeota archaeon]